MKTLSKLAFAELGIADLFAGKTFAFTAVMSGSAWALGIATANEPGYSPVPLFFASAETHDDAWAMAAQANREHLDMDEPSAMRIVCSSMAAGKVAAQ